MMNLAVTSNRTTTSTYGKDVQHTYHSNSNKRSSSPSSSSSSSLDCQSLQTSLKRIRLSCSPGELRLQKDLNVLGNFGWEPQQQQLQLTIPTITTKKSSRNNNNCDIVDAFSSHPPKWRHSETYAELILLDPLHLQLKYMGKNNNPHVSAYDFGTTSVSTTTTTLWIQIPRLYPHRPPVISRADHSPTHFVVRDSPGIIGNGSSDFDDNHQHLPIHSEQGEMFSSMDETMAIMDWSPIQQIGDLLRFILEQLYSTSRPTSSLSSSLSSVQSGLHSRVHSTQHQLQQESMWNGAVVPTTYSVLPPPTHDEMVSSSSTSWSSSTSSVTNHQQQMMSNTNHQYHHHPAGFQSVDERRLMEDVMMTHDMETSGSMITDAMTISTTTTPWTSRSRQEDPWAPNRFDKGYGRYQGMNHGSTSSLIPSTPEQDGCAMEM